MVGNGAAHDLSRVVGLWVGYLESYEHMGRARVRCGGGCACAETIIDAQIGYDFQSDSALEGLSLFIQGFNLTNEPFVAINPGEPLQVMNYQNYGRRFMGGFTYKF